jgi:hypothetical protein
LEDLRAQLQLSSDSMSRSLISDLPVCSHDRGIGEHGGGPPAQVPTKDVISGMAGRGGYRQ